MTNIICKFKKALLMLMIVAAVTVSLPMPAAATAGAVSDDVKEAMDVISLLGIMDDDNLSNGSGDNMTRGEFSRLLIMLKNDNQADESYGNQTIFPDVLSGHRYSGYINAAVMKYGIIKGYPDGTFRPEEGVTMAEAMTAALKVLGYESKDIGLFWPDDYMAAAAKAGLMESMDGILADSLLTRGNGAILALNLLTAQTKDKVQYVKSGIYKNIREDVIIAAVDGTGASGGSPTVKAGTLENLVEYKSAGIFPQSFVGRRGLLILSDSKSKEEAVGFVPCDQKYRQLVLSEATASYIRENSSKIEIKGEIPVISDGNIKKYAECYNRFLPGARLIVYYDDDSKVEYVVIQGIGGQAPVVLKSSGRSGNPLLDYFSYNGGDIYINGSRSSVSDLRKYDVVRYDENANTYYVSNFKVTGIAEDAVPSLKAPLTVKIQGVEYKVLEGARKDFLKAEAGERMTLLLTGNNEVAAMLTAREYSEVQYGYVVSASADSAEVMLLKEGRTVKLDTNKDYSDLTGKFAGVTASAKGKYYLRRGEYSPPKGNSYDINNRLLGGVRLPSDAGVFELLPSGSLVKIDAENIKYTDVIEPADIDGVLFDGSHTPIAVVLKKNVSGDVYKYGSIDIEYEKTKDEEGNDKRVEKAVTLTNSEGVTKGQRQNGLKLSPGLGGIAFDGGGKVVAAARLEKTGTVGLSAFDGENYVKAGGRMIYLPDDVQVYMEATGKYMTLEKARSLCDEFEIYVNAGVKNKDVVRYIICR